MAGQSRNPLRVESLEDRWNLSTLDPLAVAAPEPVPASANGTVKIYCAPGDPSNPIDVGEKITSIDSRPQAGTTNLVAFDTSTPEPATGGARFPALFNAKGTTNATIASADSFTVSAEGYTGGVYVAGGRFTNNQDDTGIIVGPGTGGRGSALVAPESAPTDQSGGVEKFGSKLLDIQADAAPAAADKSSPKLFLVCADGQH